MTQLFIHRKKENTELTLAVDGAGDLIVNKKGFIPLIKASYQGSTILNPSVVKRDFKRAS